MKKKKNVVCGFFSTLSVPNHIHQLTLTFGNYFNFESMTLNDIYTIKDTDTHTYTQSHTHPNTFLSFDFLLRLCNIDVGLFLDLNSFRDNG